MLIFGKWYVALRFKNDLCVGVGRTSAALLAQADRERPHKGI